MLQRPIFAYDPGSRRFAMALGPQTIRLWNLAELPGEEEDESLGELRTDGRALVGLTLTDRGELVTVFETGLVTAWSVDSIVDDEPTARWQIETGLMICEVESRRGEGDSGHAMALGGEEGAVVVLRFGGEEGPSVARVAEGHTDKIEVLTFSEDGSLLAGSARDRAISVWSTRFEDTDEGATLKRVRYLTGSGGWPLALSFSKDGRRLVSGCMDNGVYLWDLEGDGELESVRFDHHGWVEDVAWTAGDEMVLSASWDNAVRVFDADDLLPIFEFGYHGDYAVRLLMVPGTSLVFVASYDGKVTVWDWRKGRLEAILEGHSDWVTELVWLGDGVVASLSSDRSARLWSATDYEQVAFLGDPVVESFELGGDFDLESFGVGASEQKRRRQDAPDLEAMQPNVVRRFDRSAVSADDGAKGTAMMMLQQAVDKAEDVNADIIDVEEPDISGDIEEIEAGLGDELSGMVWDAISETTDTAEPADESEGSEESEESEETQELDATAEFEAAEFDAAAKLEGTDQSELSDVDELARKAFDDIEDGMDIMDSLFDPQLDGGPAEGSSADDGDDPVPTSGPLYDPTPLGPDDDINDFLPDDVELDLAFSSSVAESLSDGEGEDEAADDEATDDEAADDEIGDDGADDEDSEESDGGEESSQDEEGPPGKAEPSSAGEPHSSGADGGDENPWMRGRSPTTLTRAKPLVALQEEEDSEPPSEEPTKAPKRRSTVQGTAKGAPAGEPGGTKENWKPKSINRAALEKMARNLGKKKDKSAGDEPVKASEDDSSETATLQMENRPDLSWPSRPEEPEKSEEPKKEKKKTEVGGRPKPAGRPKEKRILPRPKKKAEKNSGEKAKGDGQGFSREIKTDEIDIEAVARHDKEKKRQRAEKALTAAKAPEVAVAAQAEDTEVAVDEAWGNRTHSWGGQAFSDGDEDDVSGPEESSTARDLDDFKRREKTLGGRKQGESLSARLKKKKKNIKGRLSRALKLDKEVEELSLGAEATEHGSEDFVSPKQDGRRLTPGERFKDAQLGVPEPEDSKEKQGSKTSETTQLVDVSLADLWERATAAAPKMGILKRPVDSDVEYQPSHQLATGHRGQVVVAVSPKEKRLLTAGNEGEVAVWDHKGKCKIRFQLTTGECVDVGYVEGENFIYGVDGNGEVHLALLPQAALGKASRIPHAVIGAVDTKYLCGCIDEDRRRLLIGGEDGSVYLWSLKSGKKLMRLDGHETPVSAVAFGNRGAITAGTDGQIRFWNQKGLLVDQIDASGAVCDLAALGGQVLWGEQSGALMTMPEGASKAEKLMGHHGEGRAVAFRDDGHRISGGEDGRLLLFDGQSAEPIQEVHVPAPIHELVIAEKTLAAACAGSVVYVFRRGRARKK